MAENWFLEKHTPNTGLRLAVERVLLDERSDFQHIEVLETREYGRMMVLDGCVMLTDRDEFVYHEMITHPTLFLHGAPEVVAIVGGGDGGSIREVAKHPSVREIHLVEIDGQVIEASRKFFPELSAGFEDPRVEIFVADGFDHLENHRNYYDAILVDSIDPIGEAAKLFTESFYAIASNALKANGVMTCQSESPFFSAPVMKTIIENLGKSFAHVAPYTAFIPTYPSGQWSFTFATKGSRKPLEIQPDWNQPFLADLKYFSPEIFNAAFVLPPWLRKALYS